MDVSSLNIFDGRDSGAETRRKSPWKCGPPTTACQTKEVSSNLQSHRNVKHSALTLGVMLDGNKDWWRDTVAC